MMLELGPWLATLALKALALCALAAVSIWSATPAARVHLLRGLLCVLITLPVMLALSVYADVGVVLPSPITAYEQGPAPFPQDAEQRAEVGANHVSSSAKSALWSLVAVAWLLGSGLAACRLLLQIKQLQLWRLNATHDHERRTADGRRVTVLWSSEVASPLSFGWRQPAILIPKSWQNAAAFTSVDIDHALDHEMAHIQRNDWPWLIISRIARAMYWWNPMLIKQHHLLLENTELVADRLALRSGTGVSDYARTLINAVSHSHSSATSLNQNSAAAVTMAGGRQWQRRIEHLYCQENTMKISITRAMLSVAVAAPLIVAQVSEAQTSAPRAAPANEPSAEHESTAPLAPTPVETPPIPVQPQSPAPPDPVLAPAATVSQALEVKAAKDAKRAEVGRLKAEGLRVRSEGKAQAQRARAVRDEAKRMRELAREQRDEARQANREAMQEQARLAEQLESLQARIAELEAKLGAVKDADPGR